MFIPQSMFPFANQSMTHIYQPPVNPLGYAYDSDFDGEPIIDNDQNCFLAEPPQKEGAFYSFAKRSLHSCENCIGVTVGGGHNPEKTGAPKPDVLAIPPLLKTSGQALQRVYENLLGIDRPMLGAESGLKKIFDSAKIRIDPVTNHIYYFDGNRTINLSEYFMCLDGFLLFMLPFVGADSNFDEYLLYFNEASKKINASKERGTLITWMRGFREEHSLFLPTPCWVHQLYKKPAYQVSLGEDSLLIVYYSKKLYAGEQMLCLCFDLVIDGRLVQLHYEPNGSLVYVPGSMQYFLSRQFPMAASANEAKVIDLTDVVGPRAVEVSKLYHLGLPDTFIAKALTDYEFVHGKKIAPWRNVAQVTLSNEEDDVVAHAVREGKPVSQSGVRLTTNEFIWQEGSQKVVLDYLNGVELNVTSTNNYLAAPTHTVWQEIERLNALTELTKKLTFRVFSRKSFPYYVIKVYVFNDSDHEWKSYCELYYDKYGTRNPSFKSIVSAREHKNSYLHLTEHRNLREDFRFYQLGKAEIFSHTALDAVDKKRDLAYHIRTSEHAALLSRFIKAITEEGSLFFGTDTQKNPLLGEDLELRYVSFYVTDDVFALIEAYLNPNTDSDVKQNLHWLLLERFSFTETVNMLSLPAGQQKRDIENQRAREVARANAIRVHERNIKLNPYGDVSANHAYTLMFCFDEGVPVKSGGMPPRSVSWPVREMPGTVPEISVMSGGQFDK